MNPTQLLCVCFVISACATGGPPRELIEARQAHQRAAKSAAAQHKDMADAEKSLKLAEWAANNDGLSPEAADKAYVAWRKIERVEALARQNQSNKQKVDAEAQLAALQERKDSNAASNRQSEEELSKVKGELEAERLARAEAEAKLRESMGKLSELGTLKQEERGLVLTLSGSVLFASGRSDLLPSAQERLGGVAEALKASKSPLLVEGHTDSFGSDASNQRLSEQRADSVRSYLVNRGIESTRVRAAGVGESRPMASNSSAEGRANNRRVEIILEK